MTLRSFAAMVLSLQALAFGCYSPHIAQGGFACGTDGGCPDNFHCGSDNRCYQGSDDRIEMSLAGAPSSMAQRNA